MSSVAKHQKDRWREIVGFGMLAFTTLLFLALVTDGYQGEPRRSLSVGDIAETSNALGVVGAFAAAVLSILTGPAAHVLYFVTCVWGLMLVRHKALDRLPLRLLGMVLLTGAVAGLLHIDLVMRTENTAPGGALGAFIGDPLLRFFGLAGANVIVGTLAIIGILLATELLFLRVFEFLQGLGLLALKGCTGLYKGACALWAFHKDRALRRRQPFREAAQRILGGQPDSAPGPEAEAPYSGYPDDQVQPAFGESENDLSRIRVQTGAAGLSAREGRESAEAGQQELPLAPDETPEPVPTQQVEVEPGELEAVAEDDGPLFQVIAGEDVAEEFEGDLAPFSIVANAAEIDQEIGSAVEDALEASTSGFDLPDDEEEEEESPFSIESLLAGGRPQAPKGPLLRCTKGLQDELPPDYEYPKEYTLPSMELFQRPPVHVSPDVTDQLRQTSVRLEETFKTFGIEARVTDVVRGPAITRFELQPAPGIKVSRFHSLADDVALALKAQGVRVEAPIPGKGRIGIEVPNKKREPVVARELFESEIFEKGTERLRLALGKDIAGAVVTTDLTAMPHLLVAGATGAGKTVCIKTFLASLLFTNTPDQLHLILIDPKMVELSIFNNIPHLITPVVIDPKKASSALNWLINEMEERYRLFAHLRVRNIDVYNQRVENGEIEVIQPETGKSGAVTVNRKLPYVVCIIDELADLMMLARAEVEGAIARLAQLARATGIHLVIATQRPSVDVLTGVIKANFPARMSFQVSSRVDSRCILDEIGAERLIGKGDMLYLPAGRSKPLRIQGAFVSDEEMEGLIAYIKTQAPCQYRDEIERFGQSDEPRDDLLEEGDELFEDAVRVVLDTGQASISMVQRRLRVGYTRAARLIDMMELKGIVGPHTGSKARDILVALPNKTDEVA